SELSEVDFSRFRELKELVFGANSFANVGSLELAGLHKLESLRFEAGAFANGFNLVLDDLPSLVDLQFSEGCFTGEASGRRLADGVSGIQISNCGKLKKLSIPKFFLKTALSFSLREMPVLEEVMIAEEALPEVIDLELLDIERVGIIAIGDGALNKCQRFTMKSVATEKAGDVFDHFGSQHGYCEERRGAEEEVGARD
ncbi:hypothetical protein BLSTO_06002, partial [Blastocystis sp. subtype 1]